MATGSIAHDVNPADFPPDLSCVPPEYHTEALRALDDGDALALFRYANNSNLAPGILFHNIRPLKARGCYERALLHALTMPSFNLHHVPEVVLRCLVTVADRAALRACGDPLRSTGPFTVYRGVAGRGRARRVPGLSWTFSRPTAAWFARRLALPDPAVFRLVATEAQVLAYVTNRQEEELLVLGDRTSQPIRCLQGAEVQRRAEEEDRKRERLAEEEDRRRKDEERERLTDPAFVARRAEFRARWDAVMAERQRLADDHGDANTANP